TGATAEAARRLRHRGRQVAAAAGDQRGPRGGRLPLLRPPPGAALRGGLRSSVGGAASPLRRQLPVSGPAPLEPAGPPAEGRHHRVQPPPTAKGAEHLLLSKTTDATTPTNATPPQRSW